jgi:hypothetical protein
MSVCFNIIYIIIGSVFTLWRGWKCLDIWQVDIKNNSQDEKKTTINMKEQRKLKIKKWKEDKMGLNPYILFQRFFNGFGTALGWFFGYLLILRIDWGKLNGFTIDRIGLGLLCFSILGICGYLPKFIDGIARIPESIVNALIKNKEK